MNDTVGAAPIFSRTDYFSYTPDGHRETQQVWNVSTGGKTIAIYVQGSVAGLGLPSITDTHFAKKRLRSFKGGKASKAGQDVMTKMQRIADKRARTVKTGSENNCF